MGRAVVAAGGCDRTQVSSRDTPVAAQLRRGQFSSLDPAADCLRADPKQNCNVSDAQIGSGFGERQTSHDATPLPALECLRRSQRVQHGAPEGGQDKQAVRGDQKLEISP